MVEVVKSSSPWNKHRDGEFRTELRWPDRLCLRHQTIGTQHLAVTGIIDVLQRIARGYKRKAQGAVLGTHPRPQRYVESQSAASDKRVTKQKELVREVGRELRLKPWT